MMPPRGSANHLAVTVSDLKRAEDIFYTPVLTFLGYQRVEALDFMTLWWSPAAQLAINLWQAKTVAKHDRYQPGFHHFAFGAGSREDVDALHDLMISKDIAVLDRPAEYPHYAPDYYAVYFADPDGLKYEFAYMTMPE